MALRKGYKQLVDEANARIRTLSVEEAKAKLGEDGVLFVDVRDVRELENEGMIPNAYSAPRGMLEFWIDPDSPYARKPLIEARELVLYCAMSWRSALAAATLQEMGVENVMHIDGGFAAWKDAGAPVVPKPSKKA
jgi:rhodanese-related sulfurtransferase